MLEELLAMGKAAEYDAWIINIGEGDQVVICLSKNYSKISLFFCIYSLIYFRTFNKIY